MEKKIDTDRDAMPFEVALEMLADPKVKLPNRTRKECRLARATVRPSKHPIVLLPDESGYEYMTGRRVEKKPLGHYTMAQLLKWQKRLITSRRRMQSKWERLVAKRDAEEDENKRKAAQILIDQIDKVVEMLIEPRLEAAEEEIARRHHERQS